MAPPKDLEQTIERWFAREAKSNRRPDFGDKTVRSVCATQLAREIRKVAKVTQR